MSQNKPLTQAAEAIPCPTETQTLRDELAIAKHIVEHSPVVLFKRTPQPDYKLIYVSENIARFGYTAQDLMSGEVLFKDMVHPEDQKRLEAEVEEHEKDKSRDYGQLYRILTKAGDVRWVEDTTTTIVDDDGKILYYHGVVVDVTDRVLAQEEVRRSEAKLKRILETAAEGFVLMDTDLKIIDVNQAYCDMLGFERANILGRHPVELATPEYRRFLEANREQLLSTKVRIFEGMYRHKAGHDVPVLIHGSTLTDHQGETLGHVGFVTDMTQQKRSLVLAREVLQSLLPKEAPKLEGLDAAGKSVAWEEIGGDYFDFLDSSLNGALTIAVGDIAGHGVDSALLMATARAVLRDRLAGATSLGMALAEVNAALYQDFLATARFMTMSLLTLEPATGRASWVRAGHDPVMVYYPDSDSFENLEGSGLPLGVLAECEYPVETAILERPCVLAVGTDGIWETRNSKNEMFGKERFLELLRKHASEPAQVIVDRVYDAVFHFAAGAKPEDDVTLVVAKLERP